MTGVYIHIPFCKSKCNYCDFASFPGQEEFLNHYLAALESEISQGPLQKADTIYIGGGTPSVLSGKQLTDLFFIIEKRFGLLPKFKESSFESNPESLSKDKIEILKKFGFSRISLGLQSFDDKELKTLGRIHDTDTFLKTYELLKQNGFENINVDLIAGLPGQKLVDFVHSLEKLIMLNPSHISVYGLQIEEGTPFFEQGILNDQLLIRKMLEEAHARLENAGYNHYEISNYAKPGLESQHNLNYWDNGEYAGYGSSAASYINGIRTQNEPDFRKYMEKIGEDQSPVISSEKLDGKAKAGERLMLGLRKLDGVTLASADENYFGKEITNLIQRGLLLRENNKIKLSNEGLYLANEVFESFVEPFDQ